MKFRLCLFALLLQLNPSCVHGQFDSATKTEAEEAPPQLEERLDCKPLAVSESADPGASESDSTRCRAAYSLSNLDEAPADTTDDSVKSVESELVRNNTVKPAIFPIDPIHTRLRGLYDFKERVHEASGLTWGVDYSILMQHASFTKSGEDTASSSVFRILGTWLRVGDRGTTFGNLVWKMETRNPIFGNPTPRDMGFDTGRIFQRRRRADASIHWYRRLVPALRAGYPGYPLGTHPRPADAPGLPKKVSGESP